MTTIAFKDGVMAGDCQTTSGGGLIVSMNTNKVFLYKGNILGVCGLYGENLTVKNWFEGGMEGECPQMSDDSEALLAVDGELFGLWEKQTMVPLNGFEFYAIGSGAAIAIGAMHMGASAVEAIETAIAHDIYTGGEITSFVVGQT